VTEEPRDEESPAAAPGERAQPGRNQPDDLLFPDRTGMTATERPLFPGPTGPNADCGNLHSPGVRSVRRVLPVGIDPDDVSGTSAVTGAPPAGPRPPGATASAVTSTTSGMPGTPSGMPGTPPPGPRPPGPAPVAAPAPGATASSSPGTPAGTIPGAVNGSARPVTGRHARGLRGTGIEGLVSGTVERDLRYRQPPSPGPLVLLGLAWAVLWSVNALRGSAWPGLIAAGLLLAAGALFLLGVLLVKIVGAGPLQGLRLGGTLVGILLRAITGVVGIVLTTLGGLLGPGGRPSSRPRRTGGHPAAAARAAVIRRFRVQDLTGHVHVCVLNGDTEGDDVRPGDAVRVIGRRDRAGLLVVRRVEVLSGIGGDVVSTVRPGMSSDVLAAQWTARLLNSTVLAVAILVAVQVWTLLR
jgi:hypothetical protein